MQRRNFVGTGIALGTGLLGSSCAGRSTSAFATAPARVPLTRTNGTLRLNSNENPLGLSPAARRAILESLGEGNRYPRQARIDCIAALAARHGLTPDHVQLGAGSTEILQMAVQATPEGAVVVTADPTFEDVGRYAAASGRRLVTVPLRADWAHDVGRMRDAAGSGPALVFICNPNNPTGTLTPSAEVDDWIRAADARVTFLVDEAYFEFAEDAGYHSSTSWIASNANVIVVRTFSKIHAMAGMRLGYALAQPATIAKLRAMQSSNNVNQLALAAGIASLGDNGFHERSLASNRAGRRILARTLEGLGLTALPSHANFVMHRIPGTAAEHQERMRSVNVLVGRPFPPLVNYARVSIGLPEEMERFAQILADFRGRGWV